MEVESTASQHTQYARKHGNGLRTSKEGDRQAHQNGEYAGHRKKDTVEISPAARWAAMEIKELEPNSQISDILAKWKEEQRQFVATEMEKHGDDFLKKIVNGDYGTLGLSKHALDALSDEQRTELNQLYEQRHIESQKQAVSEYLVYGDVGSAERFIFNALNGKVENAFDIAVQLGEMVFSDMVFAYEPYGKDLETAAADRAAGRDLAKYIAENYFDDPEEAKAFMDKINKFIKNSELRDQGYIIYFADGDPMKPNPPSEFDQWLEKTGQTELYKEEMNRLNAELNAKYDAGLISREEQAEEKSKAFRKYLNEFFKERETYYWKNIPPDKVWDKAATWEESKEMNCDSRFSMFSEENKAWYVAFDAKVNLVQSIIDNAKQITDFSGNEKWNNLMNLLSKAA
jgi:hypothetical protein